MGKEGMKFKKRAALSYIPSSEKELKADNEATCYNVHRKEDKKEDALSLGV